MNGRICLPFQFFCFYGKIGCLLLLLKTTMMTCVTAAVLLALLALPSVAIDPQYHLRSRLGYHSSPSCEYIPTCVYDNITGYTEVCADLVVSSSEKNETVGQVCVSTIADNLQACYDTEGSGYYLTDIRAWTGKDPTRDGDTAIGRFRATNISSGVSFQCISIPLIEIDAQCCLGSEYFSKTLFLISHANVREKNQSSQLLPSLGSSAYLPASRESSGTRITKRTIGTDNMPCSGCHIGDMVIPYTLSCDCVFSQSESEDEGSVPSYPPNQIGTISPTESPSFISTYKPSVSFGTSSTPSNSLVNDTSMIPSEAKSWSPSVSPSNVSSTTPSISTESPTPPSTISPNSTISPSTPHGGAASSSPTYTNVSSSTPSASDAPTTMPSSTVPKVSTSSSPVGELSAFPTMAPSGLSIIASSGSPIIAPTSLPAKVPSGLPSTEPSSTHKPTAVPVPTFTAFPTMSPSSLPTMAPSGLPTMAPSGLPTMAPSGLLTMSPTSRPPATRSATSVIPTMSTSLFLSDQPSLQPTTPTATQSGPLSGGPSMMPASTIYPSLSPFSLPTPSGSHCTWTCENNQPTVAPNAECYTDIWKGSEIVPRSCYPLVASQSIGIGSVCVEATAAGADNLTVTYDVSRSIYCLIETEAWAGKNVTEFSSSVGDSTFFSAKEAYILMDCVKSATLTVPIDIQEQCKSSPHKSETFDLLARASVVMFYGNGTILGDTIWSQGSCIDNAQCSATFSEFSLSCFCGSDAPSQIPSGSPTKVPSFVPSILPSSMPSVQPVFLPAMQSSGPSTILSNTVEPTMGVSPETISTTDSPTLTPSEQPTVATLTTTTQPLGSPTQAPVESSTATPTEGPTIPLEALWNWPGPVTNTCVAKNGHCNDNDRCCHGLTCNEHTCITEWKQYKLDQKAQQKNGSSSSAKSSASTSCASENDPCRLTTDCCGAYDNASCQRGSCQRCSKRNLKCGKNEQCCSGWCSKGLCT